MPKLVVSIDSVVIKDVELVKQHTTLGRRPYNDIVIDNLAVSGEHAALHMENNVVEVEDLRSTNGTYVNGKSIVRQELRHGDTLEVGKYKIRFYSEPVEQFEHTMFLKPDSLPGKAAPAGTDTAKQQGNKDSEPAAGSEGDGDRSGAQPASKSSNAAEAGHAAAPTTPVPLDTVAVDFPAATVGTSATGAAASTGAAAAAAQAPASTPNTTVAPTPAAGTAVIRYLSGVTTGRELPLTKVVTTLGKPGIAVASVTHRRNAFVLAHIEGTEPLTVNGTSIGSEAVQLKDGDLVTLAGTQMQFVLK